MIDGQVATQMPIGTSIPAPRGPLPWRRLAAYTGAGIVSGLVNLILFHLARQAGVTPHLAWFAAFEIGALVAFLLHRHVTWRDRRVRTFLALLRQFVKAQAGNLAALAISGLIFAAFVHAGLPDDLDDVAGLGAGFLVNFALAHHFIYGSHRYRERWHRSGRTGSRARPRHR